MITIKGKEYKVKYSIRALFYWEQITGKAFQLNNLLDNYLFMYAILLANNSDVLSWDEFIDAIDEDPGILKQIEKTIEAAQKKNEAFDNDDGFQKKS